MPTWGDILQEIQAEQTRQSAFPQAVARAISPFDVVRRKYLSELAQYTGRSTILYATKWTQFSPDISPELISMVAEDIQGFMEAMHNLPDDGLDLIIHLPGGSPTSANSANDGSVPISDGTCSPYACTSDTSAHACACANSAGRRQTPQSAQKAIGETPT